MNPRVAVELGVEGGGKLLALPGSNDVTIYGGDGLTVVGGNRLDVGSTDEGHRDFLTHASDGTRGVEAAQLTTVGITAHLNVHRTQTPF